MNDTVKSSLLSLSVVIPVYGCADSLSELHQRLTAALGSFSGSYEIILVNDHSPDSSWKQVQKLATSDPRVLGVSLSRNFGQHAAITAGLDRATGQWVVVMDCDLQDAPEEILNLYAHAQNHHLDVVFGRRANRQDAASKRWAGQAFHRVFAWLSGQQQDPATGNFGIFHQRVVAALRLLREPTRAFPLQVRWLGFRQGALDVQHAARRHGKSGYRFGQLFRLAFAVVLAYSDKPLRLMMKLGTGIVAMSLLGAVALAVGLWPTAGGTTTWLAGLLVSFWLLGGLLLAGLGLVGLYVSRTFDGVKNRPLYVVREETSPLMDA